MGEGVDEALDGGLEGVRCFAIIRRWERNVESPYLTSGCNRPLLRSFQARGFENCLHEAIWFNTAARLQLLTNCTLLEESSG